MSKQVVRVVNEYTHYVVSHSPGGGGGGGSLTDCNGATPQTEASVNAASTDLASVIALCNQLRAALIANGICV